MLEEVRNLFQLLESLVGVVEDQGLEDSL